MQKLAGSYVWHYVSDEHKIVGVKESREYLVCFEVEEKSGPVWKMKLVHWYEKGAMISKRSRNPAMIRRGRPKFLRAALIFSLVISSSLLK